jgi:hypothetical protein
MAGLSALCGAAVGMVDAVRISLVLFERGIVGFPSNSCISLGLEFNDRFFGLRWINPRADSGPMEIHQLHAPLNGPTWKLQFVTGGGN